MKTLINKFNNITIVEKIILLFPFIDLITSLMVEKSLGWLSIGMIFRGFFLIFMISYTLYKKKFFKYFIFILLFLFLFLTFKVLNGEYDIIFNEIKTFIKFFNYPILLLCFITYFRNHEVDLFTDLKFINFIYLLFILIPILTKTSFDAYNHRKDGYTGWFYSANEISIIFAIFSPYALYGFYKIKNKFFSIAIFIIYMLICYSLGTKTTILGLLFSIIAYIIIGYKQFSIKKEKNILVLSILSFIILAVFFPFSFLYKNSVDQANHYDSIQNSFDTNDIIKDINEINQDVNSLNIEPNVTTIDEKNNSEENKVNSNTNVSSDRKYTSNKIINMIFSSRDIYFYKLIKRYNFSISNILFGIGNSTLLCGDFVSNIVELDYVDIIILYGILGSILYFWYTIKYLKIIIKYILKNVKVFYTDYKFFVPFISIIMFMIIAFFAGHVFGAPTINCYAALIFANLYCYVEKKVKVIHKDSLKENILGIDVLNTTYEDLKQFIIDDIDNNRKSSIVAINPEKILIARKNVQIKQLLKSFTYQIPDGIGVIYASKLKKGNIKTRITGIDTMDMLCQTSNEKKYKIFLYGAKENVIKKTKHKLEKKYPNLNITGYINGYEKDEEKIVNTINSCHPNIIFVALGSPRQELFIMKNIDRIDCNIFQGVGGSFDVFSGEVKRAPKWMQKRGLEWLHRLFNDPKRIFRQLKFAKFLMLAMFEEKNENQSSNKTL